MSGSMLFNLPNMLTLSRIVAIPLVVACFWLDRGWAQWFSMALFVAAAVTDWFDGYFARRYHQISRFGRFLDPIADKLLVAAALVMLVDNSTLAGVNVLAALIILAREILPNIISILIVDFSLRVASAILLTASLAYLGIGVKPPTPAWGLMVKEGQQFLQIAPWLVIFPCAAIALISIGTVLTGDRLRRAVAIPDQRGR